MPRLRRPCHLATPRELCGACGSPRQVCHATLDTLSIAHVDCDAFNATVEERDRPDLVDRPVIIDGGSCGVVLACCYVARLYGVPLDDADVQRTGGLRGCGGDPIGHGEISLGRTRGARRDAAADAARRAVVDRRSLSRPWRHQGTPRRLSVPALHSPFGSKASSVSPCRSAGEADGVTRFRLIGVGADALVEGQAADPCWTANSTGRGGSNTRWIKFAADSAGAPCDWAATCRPPAIRHTLRHFGAGRGGDRMSICGQQFGLASGSISSSLARMEYSP